MKDSLQLPYPLYIKWKYYFEIEHTCIYNDTNISLAPYCALSLASEITSHITTLLKSI